jgi:hypothetical protein
MVTPQSDYQGTHPKVVPRGTDTNIYSIFRDELSLRRSLYTSSSQTTKKCFLVVLTIYSLHPEDQT